MASLTNSHWFALKRLLMYLKGTIQFGLTFIKPDGQDLVVFYDANYVGCPNDKHKICSFCVYVGSCLFAQQSSKKQVISHTSTESEYCTMTIALI